MHTLHASLYTDPDVFRKETAQIFMEEWVPIAHTTEFLKDQYVIERRFVHHSILLVRDLQVFRAFYNVCPHRAGPLLWSEDSISVKALRCRYHGWRYDLEGLCTHQPDFGTKVDARLESIHVQIWNGLLFVCLSANPPVFRWPTVLYKHAPSLLPFVFHRTASHQISCNWKTYVENYLEGYHIPYLHPSLRSSIQMSQYKIHCHDTIITHEVPTKGESDVAGFWAYLWPMTALNMYGSSMSIERINPIDTNNIEIHYIYLSMEGTTVEDRERAIGMSKQVTQEDILICNAVAKNLRTGIYTKGSLSPKHEQGLHHMYALRAKALT